MPLTRPPVLPVWADTGDKTQPTDLEIAAGWPVTSIPPSRQRFNWFFSVVSNAYRYLTRRGIPDWISTETFEIGDIQRSLVDGKTYRSMVAANINFEPSINPLKWERWGFSLSELWAYISSGLYGGACPNTGPASAPTLANPYLEYTSALGEIWRYVGGVWKVIASHYGVDFANATYAIAANTQQVVQSFTAPRDGIIQCSISSFTAAGQAGNGLYVEGKYNTLKICADSTLSDIIGRQQYVSAAQTMAVSAGAVITMEIFSQNALSGNVRASVRYKN